VSNQRIRAIIILDVLLIFMTTTWLLISITKGMSEIELWYNFVYVTLNTSTLILNLTVLQK